MVLEESGPIGKPIYWEKAYENALQWDEEHLPPRHEYEGPRSSSGVPSGSKENPGMIILLNTSNYTWDGYDIGDNYPRNAFRGYAALRPRKDIHKVDGIEFYVMSWKGEWCDGWPYDGDGYLPVELIPPSIKKILPVGCKWIVGRLRAGELETQVRLPGGCGGFEASQFVRA